MTVTPEAPGQRARARRTGPWLADVVVGWVLLCLLAVMQLLGDLALVGASFLSAVAEADSGEPCGAGPDSVLACDAGRASIVVAAVVPWGVIVLAGATLLLLGLRRPRLVVCWLPLAAGAVTVALWLVGNALA